MSKSKKIIILAIVFIVTLILASYSSSKMDEFIEKKASSYDYDYFSTTVLDKKTVHYVDDPSEHYVLISDSKYTDGKETWVEYDFPAEIGDTIHLYKYNNNFYTSLRGFVSPGFTLLNFFLIPVPLIITVYFLFFKKKKEEKI